MLKTYSTSIFMPELGYSRKAVEEKFVSSQCILSPEHSLV
jgi:hypothetical protein